MENREDKIFKNILKYSSYIIILFALVIIITLVKGSYEALKKIGISFLFQTDFNPINEKYGAKVFLTGTILTSIIALIFCIPFALSLSILIGEYYEKTFIGNSLKSMIDFLASIPSVIIGFWGLTILVPFIKKNFNYNPSGLGIFTASLVLSAMIIPYATSIAIEVIKLVPQDIKEAAYSLGATRYEVITKISLNYAKSGIFSGFILAFGRALGETMAVTMLIGNNLKMPKTVFDLGNTIASIIANQFNEASSSLHTSVLIELALILFIVNIAINILANIIIKRIGVYTAKYQ
ncbi:MAG: phosphate ABC transporter permease subunit PstC [Spirochaetes bacterium]|nr:phosphate ABC transporter permease subunit PstC [Spirochaetota bacterium]